MMEGWMDWKDIFSGHKKQMVWNISLMKSNKANLLALAYCDLSEWK
jgi:hypothetical protein